jgi:hypothetical protein
MNWVWKIGVLHGYGEAIWQEMAGQVRRITKPILTPQGLVLVKPVFMVASTEKEPQFFANDIVVISLDAQEGLVADVERVWSGSGIIPVNGQRITVE